MDHKIYLYDRESFQLKGTCDRHNSQIQNFDFSSDGSFIQSDASDYEHLYFEAQDGKAFPQGSQLCDIAWHEWTCTYGWPVQGVWPKISSIADGAEKLSADPSTVDRSVDSRYF